MGLLALLRNEGGSVGTSVAQTIQERREQFHTLRLNEHLDPFSPNMTQFLHNAHQYFLQQTGDPAGSREMAEQLLANLRDQQALSLSYFDIFTVLAGVGSAAGVSRTADEKLESREGPTHRGGMSDGPRHMATDSRPEFTFP